MSRLYFDCPIKALYMQKHFGVKFECKYDPEDEGYEPEIDGEFYNFSDASLDQPCMIDELEIDLESFRKIYIAKESEPIFQPKEGDVVWSWEGSKAFLMYLNWFDEESKFWQTSSGKSDTCTSSTEPSNEWIIIERQGKNFFQPLIEK